MPKDLALISDSNAEAIVIASMIHNPEFCAYADVLKPRYFRDTLNQCLFWSIMELYNSGVSNIDAVNLTAMLNSNKAVKNQVKKYDFKDINTFVEMCSYASRSDLDEFKMYCKRVATLAYKREMAMVSNQIETACFDDNYDLQKLSNLVNEKLDHLTERYVVSDNIQKFGDKIDDIYDEIVARRGENGLSGVPSMIPALNNYITYEPTELVMFKARMKRGKSAFLMNELVNMLRNNLSILYVDTEMSDRNFAERLLANLTGIKVRDIKSGNYTDEGARKIKQAEDWIKTRNFVHLYDPDLTNDKLFSTCKLLKNQMNLDGLLYDYLKTPDNILSTSEAYNAAGATTDFIKNKVLGTLGIFGVTATQIGRSGMVADSDKIERYVSASILWDRKTPEMIQNDGPQCGNFFLQIQLNRLGEQMTDDEYIDVNFDGDRMRISQAEQHKETTPFDDEN